MVAEVDESSVSDVLQTEDEIVSQLRDENHEIRAKSDECLRLGLETRLLVIRSKNSLALFFVCMTLPALTSLRRHWRTGQLRGTVCNLFTFLSSNTWPSGHTRQVLVRRLSWPSTDYERCLQFFRCLRGKPTTCSKSLQ